MSKKKKAPKRRGSRGQPARAATRQHATARDIVLEAVISLRDIVFRLIDRGHVGTAVTFGTFALIAFLAASLDKEILLSVVDGITGVVAGLLLGVIIVLLVVLRKQREIFQREINRMAENKVELERRLDPERTSTLDSVEE